MADRLRDKVAVVTGAAAGIGEATAERFAAEGAKVTLLDIDQAGADVALRIRARGHEAIFMRADISVEADVRSAMDGAISAFGRIDILVNNAAVFVLKGLEATPEEWRRSLDVNVIGSALCARYAAEAMKRDSGGAIVNLASISSYIGQPGFLTYSATKAALLTMTRCMAVDLAPHKIRVNCVCPATIRTAATDRHMAQTGQSESQFLAEQAPQHLLGRVGTPAEVANAILFLASDEASFITATPLLVDGGYLAR
ncbi:MAG: SDR family oxidoreductase [Alphaproteobacteria bacterium]|nr:SDR family oxidoreductase [Alphaproteobacteria bacterium]